MAQRIGFVTAPDGTRIAYATHGHGYPLVRAPHWLSHIQYEWDSPIWQPWLAALGARFHVLRYDERGNGLSDWDVHDFSFEAWMEDMELVVEAARYERFALFGISQGAQLAIAYAVRHPERVSHLVILGGYLTGWGHVELTDAIRDEIAALITLMRVGWGRQSPIFRRVWTTKFVPDGDEDLLRAYDELMRRTASPANAARFEEAFGRIDVAGLAPLVRCPTLVLHLDGDQVVGFEEGLRVAAAIPGARFVQLNGRNHVLRPDEPAWAAFLAELDEFVGSPPSGPPAPGPAGEALTHRELEVLELVAAGRTNMEIGASLGLSVRTIERHLSNIYLKLGLSGKAARAAAAAHAPELRLRAAATV
jgi:pimeloyl-ACP methyl ester carboxylesterase/DNA-binding CsgD family transcriptional regulator